MGRELFAAFRANALGAEEGAMTFQAAEPGTRPSRVRTPRRFTIISSSHKESRHEHPRASCAPGR